MSVYCSYCGKRGHNKLGCPERKKQARENPDGYLARQIEREEELRRRAVASRTCTYCDKPGHNRRGCKTLKQDKVLVERANIDYQDEFAESLTAVGFGLGSLVKIPQGSVEDKFSQYIVAMVTDIDWQGVDITNRDAPSLSYSQTSRTIANARVVKSVGWEEEPGSWRGPPAQNDRFNIMIENLVMLTPDSFASADEYTQNRLRTLEVLSPTSFKNKRDHKDSMPGNLARAFRFDLSHTSERWEKSRISMHNDVWKNIYPEECKTAQELVTQARYT